MKKFITLFATVTLLLVSHICQGQIHFSKNANVYDDNNNAKVGQQYIAANITNGTGTMTIGSRTMKATVTNTKRDLILWKKIRKFWVSQMKISLILE